MKSQKKILIVGGTGFIGFHLAKICIKKGYQVICVSTKKPLFSRRVTKVKYIICDIRKRKELEKKIKKTFDYVINLGGYVDHSNKKKVYESHYQGCHNLANLFLKTKIKRFIQLGSGMEYGKSKTPHFEKSKCFPKSIYSLSKYKASIYLLNLYKKNNFPCSILRLYQAYGPNQDFNRLIPEVIKACLLNKRFNCSEGSQKRDFLYIDDLIELLIKIIKTKKIKSDVYNVGCGRAVAVKNVIEKINLIIKRGKPNFGGIIMRKDEVMSLYPNIKKIKKTFNWNPKTSMFKGLRKTINYYEKK